MAEPGIIELRCPNCRRFLGEIREFGRAVCANCGGEVTYRSKTERRRVLHSLETSDTIAEATS